MKISVKGYKSIAAEQSIELPGLTVLAGANSSGKSSFMQPMLLIKQTLSSEYDAGPLRLDGANVRLTDSSQIISRVALDAQKSFSLGFCGEEGEVRVTYGLENGVEVSSVFCKDENHRDGITVHSKLTQAEMQAILAEEPGLLAWAFRQPPIFAQAVLARQRCFLELRGRRDATEPFFTMVEPARSLAALAARLIHVPGLRSKPERMYGAALAEAVYPGLFENYIASIVYHWKAAGDPRFALLGQNLADLGLATAIDASKIDDSRLELLVSRHRNSPDVVNIADVGFGVSQILPVLVSLLAAEKDQIVYIEQPELHLHPRTQFHLARIIASGVTTRGLRAVIETHSPSLVRGVQTLVAQQILPAETVSLNWFKQQDSGQTEIFSATPDRYGAYGDWPVDFDDVALDADQAYLDAVEQAVANEI